MWRLYLILARLMHVISVLASVYKVVKVFDLISEIKTTNSKSKTFSMQLCWNFCIVYMLVCDWASIRVTGKLIIFEIEFTHDKLFDIKWSQTEIYWLKGEKETVIFKKRSVTKKIKIYIFISFQDMVNSLVKK